MGPQRIRHDLGTEQQKLILQFWKDHAWYKNKNQKYMLIIVLDKMDNKTINTMSKKKAF